MEIKRFFVPSDAFVDDKVVITGSEHIHLSNVLRFRVGYKLILCDNSGNDYHCIVESIGSKQTVCRIETIEKNNTEHQKSIVLLVGLIKPDKFEIALQKSVELGVSEIVPFISKNTTEKTVRIERLNRIVTEACKQCGRAILPVVHDPVSYSEALNRAKGKKILAYEKQRSVSIKNVLKDVDNYDAVTVAIGSEGGFTVDEVALAEEKGFVAVSLGKRILRAETAVITALANVSLFLED